jgi:hypothetical protein
MIPPPPEKPRKKYINIQRARGGGCCKTKKTINFCGKLSFNVSFLAYIFTTPTYTTTIITFEPYALIVEFQHLIVRFNKISLFYIYH